MGKPAARVTDNAFCPKHHEATVTGPGAVNVLVGNHPAARKGDHLICKGGSKDEFLYGEASVLICGSPAATTQSLDGHQGVVTVGCPSVLIGSNAGDATKLGRATMRSELLAAAYAKAAAMPPGAPHDALVNAADTLNRLNVAVEDARLSWSVYQDKGAPEGWTRVQEFPGTDGFYAAAYRSDVDGSFVVAFRGTEDAEDVDQDVRQGLGVSSGQYQNAVTLAREFEELYPGTRFTGHSLGGGLASAAALATSSRANTFNAAGLSAGTARHYGFSRDNNEKLIDAYRTDWEVLTTASDGALGLIGAPMGKRYTLPFEKKKGPVLGPFSLPDIHLAFPLKLNFPISVELPNLAQGIDNHTQFEEAMETQKAAAAEFIRAAL